LCHPSFSRDEVIAVITVVTAVAVVTAVVTAVAAVAHPVGVVTTRQQQPCRILFNEQRVLLLQETTR
jgi:hypothetical protein